jgi:hypothetical protein
MSRLASLNSKRNSKSSLRRPIGGPQQPLWVARKYRVSPALVNNSCCRRKLTLLKCLLNPLAALVATDQKSIEFVVLKYVPNLVRGEQRNIGLLALKRNGELPAFTAVRFIQNFGPLLEFDPDADIGMLRALFEEIGREFSRDPDTYLQTMLDSFSNIIQITDRKTSPFSGDFAMGVDRLAILYLPWEMRTLELDSE